MTQWLVYYLGAGLVVLVFMLLRARLNFNRSEKGAPRIRMNKLPKPVDTMDAIVAYVMYLAVFLLWPLFVALLAYELILEKQNKPSDMDEGPRFSAKPEYLLEQLSPEEIEAREIVADPLGAVPDLPFGHLHSAWVSFKNQVQESDELWSFRSPACEDSNSTRWQHGAEGYALRRNGEIVKEFISAAG